MPLSAKKSVALAVAGVVAVAGALGIAIIYSGVIDVGARKPHHALTHWVLETTMERSVERRAARIVPPPRYLATDHTKRHFGEMCENCHGGPGKEPSEIGKGLRPDPPDLAKVADHLSPSELFWIMENGIRMTGMPAFAETHGEKELWEMVDFVKSLPRLSPEEYRRQVGSAPSHRH